MARQEYRIEQMDHACRWVAIGTCPDSAGAQQYMARMQKMSPSTAWRVIEHPSRTIVVCHDPLNDEQRCDAIARATA